MLNEEAVCIATVCVFIFRGPRIPPVVYCFSPPSPFRLPALQPLVEGTVFYFFIFLVCSACDPWYVK